MIWILFYYNSLPDMPEGCRLFSPEIMHRDFFQCNPTNTGHHAYPKFESLSYDEGCHRREVRAFLKKSDPDKYGIFYTRHTPLSGARKNKVVGYFKVGSRLPGPKVGFRASEAVLLPRAQCKEIGYDKRGVPVSWGRSEYRDEIDKILRELQRKTRDNLAGKYQEETAKVMKKLSTAAGRRQLIKNCEQCSVRSSCYWGRKRNKDLNKLYSQECNVLQRLLKLLSQKRSSRTVFNQYSHGDILNNLQAYLEYFIRHKSSVLFVGEAPGYNGCRLTGIPFTSGAVIANSGHSIFKQLRVKIHLQRVATEPTATMVWDILDKRKIIPILWNAFPFHAHHPGNAESNRKPTAAELDEGKEFLKMVYRLFSPSKLCALGRVGEGVLKDLFPGKDVTYIRHPARGGKRDFIGGMQRILC
jgi:uracil-DNA glycosylase